MINTSTVKSTEVNTLPKKVDEPRNGDVEKQNLQKQREAAPGLHDPNQFPDGGFTAWLCVGGGFCCAFCSFGWANGKTLETYSLIETLICLYSNRRVPRVLREGFACFVLTVDNIMDRLVRNIFHVLWSPYHWESLRQLRSSMDPAGRHFPTRFRSDGKF